MGSGTLTNYGSLEAAAHPRGHERPSSRVLVSLRSAVSNLAVTPAVDLGRQPAGFGVLALDCHSRPKLSAARPPEDLHRPLRVRGKR
jgi:hypothetical protein